LLDRVAGRCTKEQGGEGVSHESEPRTTPEDPEATLMRTLDRASAAGAWETVALLAAELRERRLARSGVAMLADRARRGTTE
jgi:hypothetical protein